MIAEQTFMQMQLHYNKKPSHVDGFFLAKDCDFNKKGIIVKFRNASTQCQNLKALYFLTGDALSMVLISPFSTKRTTLTS